MIEEKRQTTRRNRGCVKRVCSNYQCPAERRHRNCGFSQIIGRSKTRKSIFGLRSRVPSTVLEIESDTGTPARERVRIRYLYLLDAIDIRRNGAANDCRHKPVAVGHANTRSNNPEDRKTIKGTVPPSNL